MKKILILTCCLLCLLTVSACGKDMSDSPYVGTWTGTTATYEGLEMSVADIYGAFDLTLEANGTATVVNSDGETSGSWNETDTGIIIPGSDGDLEFTADGDKLTYDFDGMIIYFEKQ